jgi:hypothetical protein
MSEGGAFLFAAFVIGVGATLVMGFWAIFLRRAFGIPPLDYPLVGRRLGHMPRGRFAHDRIVAATPIRWERMIGWIAHYALGVRPDPVPKEVRQGERHLAGRAGEPLHGLPAQQ